MAFLDDLRRRYPQGITQGLLGNPAIMLGAGGLLGGMSGQNPAQALLGTGSKTLQLSQKINQMNALKELGSLEGLTDLEKKLLPIAPNLVLKSILEKRKSKNFLRKLTLSELEDNSLPAGTLAYWKEDETIDIRSKPTAEEIKKRSSLKTVDSMLTKSMTLYKKLDKPVGVADYAHAQAFVGKAFGTQFAKDYTEMQSYVKQMTTFLTQAISGAQVSEQEAERIKGLIPQMTDNEATFEGKAKALKSYLNDARKNYGDNLTKGIEEMDVTKYEEMIPGKKKKKEEEVIEEVTIGEDGIYDLTVTGG
jgi:hypothetical protein